MSEIPNNAGPSPEFLALRMLTDAEVRAAIQEVFAHQGMLAGMRKMLPASLCEQLLRASSSVQNSTEFQQQLMSPFLDYVRDISISRLTNAGLEDLDNNTHYLFISNHRDIGLDSAYLNRALFDHGFSTTQIAIGDNLMTHRLAALIFKINKSFAVLRSGNPRELYQHSLNMSAYIYEQISTNQASIWIAQREGRAKDGNDETQPGLLKMLGLAAEDDWVTHFRNLRMVPVSISYEYDPTALVKTLAHLKKLRDATWTKPMNEDVQHILLGISGQKGQVHLQFGQPLEEALLPLASLSGVRKQTEALAAIIDQQIQMGYRLHGINYYAYDVLYGTDMLQQQGDNGSSYEGYFEQLFHELPADQFDEGRQYLLGMYANPVRNALKWR
ncbi:MAG: glycerol acyltransferase [Saprospiraceae bacterium]